MKLVGAVWFFQVANYLDRVAMSFAGPSIMKSLSMDPSAFGIVLSSFGVGYFLAQIPGGLLADRWGARPLLVIAPLFWAMFTGATGLVASVAGFAIVRTCFGIAEGISNASCYKVIGDHFNSQQRARAVGIWATAFAVAPAFAGPLVGTLLVAYGWQAVFFMMMAPALIAALVNYLIIPAKQSAPASSVGTDRTESFGRVLSHPSLWLIALTYFAFNIAYWGYLSWMPSYLALERHIDVKSIGMLGGIPYVCALFGLVLAGWLGSGPLYRFRPQLLATSYLCAGLSLFLAYRADTLPMSLIGLSSAALFLYGGLGPFGAIVLDLAPERYRAAYSGVVNTAGQIGGAVAPVVVGFMVSETGNFATGFGFMVIGLLIAAACLLAVGRLLVLKPAAPMAAT
jgi:sugar phosphate permease